ncbi:MAG: response regulator [Bacillota bacterium]
MSVKNKLLIVDDSPLFRARMSNFLKRHYSFDIEEINSVREMNEYLNSTDINDILLIILDHYLPDGTGLAAIKNYRQLTGTEKVPFILVSARVSKDVVADAYKEGAKDVIVKPVNYEQLKNRIDRIISPEHVAKEAKSIMDHHRQIQMEIKRAQRGEYEVSIVLAGIFKKLDYKSVHKESASVDAIDLKQRYPEELQNIMRETDAIISLSPSEYLFVLPFTGADGIVVVKEKLAGIFMKLVSKEERNNLLMILGAATYPEDGDTADQLISSIEEDFKAQFKTLTQVPARKKPQNKAALKQDNEEQDEQSNTDETQIDQDIPEEVLGHDSVENKPQD